MARGDHIRVRRLVYSHHGIDCGDGTVIHYAGTPWRRKEAAIERKPLEEFAAGKSVKTVPHESAFSPDEVFARAEQKMGEQDYSLLFNNCEHFATWCATGKPESRQVKKGIRAAGGVLVSALAALIIFRRK